MFKLQMHSRRKSIPRKGINGSSQEELTVKEGMWFLINLMGT